MFSIRHLFATFWRRILIEYGLWLSFFIHNAMYSHVVQNKFSIWMGKNGNAWRVHHNEKNKKKLEYHRALQTLSYGMWTRTVDLYLNMICHERFKADFRTYSWQMPQQKISRWQNKNETTWNRCFRGFFTDLFFAVRFLSWSEFPLFLVRVYT